MKENNVDPSEWVSLYGDYLYRFALSRVSDPSAAEDIVQETFLAGFKNLDKFDGRVEVKFWLRAILRNKSVDYLRKHLREIPTDEIQKYDVEPNNYRKLTGVPSNKIDQTPFEPEKVIDRKEFWAVFNKCMGKLKDPMHDIYMLKEIEGIKNEDLCKEFDITPNNLWVIIHRARKQLKACLKKNWDN